MHDARTNSCLGTHAARVNSFGLHSALDNSGAHVNSDECTYNSCGGVGRGTKPMSILAVEKLASFKQAPGRLHVETWAGRNGNSCLPISQVVEIMSGCADMVTRLSPPLFSSVWTGQRSSEWDRLVTSGENSQVWGMVVPGCLSGEQCIFRFRCIC